VCAKSSTQNLSPILIKLVRPYPDTQRLVVFRLTFMVSALPCEIKIRIFTKLPIESTLMYLLQVCTGRATCGLKCSLLQRAGWAEKLRPVCSSNTVKRQTETPAIEFFSLFLALRRDLRLASYSDAVRRNACTRRISHCPGGDFV